MKTPPFKMTRKALIDWIFDNDFNYWANLYIEENIVRGIDQDEFVEIIYRIIQDEVDYYAGDYRDYLIREEDHA